MSFFSKIKNAFKNISPTKQDNDITLIEDILLSSDFGHRLSNSIALQLKNSTDINADLSMIIKSIISPYILDIPHSFNSAPISIMLVGVNGSGKTTTIAKLASFFKNSGLSVDIAACDTFRVAATEQLTIWASMLRCKIFTSEKTTDPASVAYEALTKTKSDVLLIDTAGRLQNNTNLMNELSKISKVLKKINSEAPHFTYLTLDATTGQNAVDQVIEFNKACKISGIILNKMDGGAKGGVIVRIIDELKIPIVAIGNGESLENLHQFSIDDFLKELCINSPH